MIYLPDDKISIVAMINKFEDDCIRGIVKDLIWTVTNMIDQTK